MDINYWAVIAVVAFAVAFGFAWYAQPIFGKIWIRLMKRTPEDFKDAPMLVPMVTLVVGAVVMALVMDFFVGLAGTASAIGGMWVGFLAWLGFVAFGSLVDYTFSRHPMGLWAINYLYHLIVFLFAGAVLAAWV